jgi:hypothetical protein
MTLFAELNGNRIVSGVIAFHFLGIPFGDVLLDKVADVSGAQTLTLGPLTMKCTAVNVGTFSGSTRVRVVGGAGGWRKQINAKSYQRPLGVKKSTILGDAARDCGETIVVDADASIGSAFVRQTAIAARVLEQVGDPWWVRNDGVTEVGERDTSQISSHFNVMSTQLAIGQVFLATDDLQDWNPGRRFQTPTISMRTISSVMHHIEKDRIRTEAWVLP